MNLIPKREYISKVLSVSVIKFDNQYLYIDHDYKQVWKLNITTLMTLLQHTADINEISLASIIDSFTNDDIEIEQSFDYIASMYAKNKFDIKFNVNL